jgi:hypothetical protein
MMPLTLADAVVWLELCRAPHGWPIRGGRVIQPAWLDPAVGAALLAELEVERAIERRDGKVAVTNQRFRGDPDLAMLLREIAGERRPRSAWWWIDRIARREPHLRQLERLRPDRLVGEYDQPTRGLFGTRNVRRCFAPDWERERWWMERLHAAVEGKPSDQKTLALLAIFCVAGWYRSKGYRQEQDRVAKLIDDSWIASALEKSLCLQTYVAL